MNQGRYKTLSFTRAGALAPAALAIALLATVLLPLLAMGEGGDMASNAGLEESARAFFLARASMTVEAAAQPLLAAGASAVPAVLRAASGDRGRQRAVQFFARMGSASFDPLFAALSDPDLGARAANALLDLEGPGDGARTPAYLVCLRKQAAVRQSCGIAMVRSLSPKAGRQASALAEALTDPEAEVRAFAAAGLAQLGPKAKPALPALTAALADPFPAVRWAAADALAGIGRGARSATPALKALKSDSDGEVRRRAAAALEKVGG